MLTCQQMSKAAAASGNGKSSANDAVANGSVLPTPSDSYNSNATNTVTPYAGIAAS